MFGIFADRSGEEGELLLGEWSESFDLGAPHTPERWTVEQYEAQWRGALQRLVDVGIPAALLLDAPSGVKLRAWVCYPEGARVYVQFKEFTIGENAIELQEGGVITGIEPRETFTDYGLPIQERYCELSDVIDFLAGAL